MILEFCIAEAYFELYSLFNWELMDFLFVGLYSIPGRMNNHPAESGHTAIFFTQNLCNAHSKH